MLTFDAVNSPNKYFSAIKTTFIYETIITL